MSKTHALSRPVAVGVAAALGLATAFAAVPANAATGPTVAYGGSAAGSAVRVGDVVRSNWTAQVPLCTTALGVTHSDKTAAVNVSGVGSIGAVTNTVQSRKVAAGLQSHGNSYTAATSLLGGVIKAVAITSDATVTHTKSGYTLAGSVDLVKLTIAGKTIPVSPKPNTTITVPGLATIVLNHQVRTNSGGTHGITVDALVVTLLPNALSGQPGARVVVSRATATMQEPMNHHAWGSAWGTTVSLAGLLNSGKTAPVYLPCGGGNVTRTNSTAGLNIPGVLTGGAVTSSGKSADSRTKTTATTSNSVANVNLLNGAIIVKAITAKATATRSGKTLTRSTAGSSILGLTVMGQDFSTAGKDHGVYAIPGLGSLSLEQATNFASGVAICGLKLVLDTAQGGLGAGTVITVACAQAGVLK